MKRIVTISREFASGGRSIGQQVAKELGIDFYDKEIIDLSAEQSGLSADYISKTEQTLSSSWIYSLVVGSAYSASSSVSAPTGSRLGMLPLADQVFNAQRKVIIDLAKKGPCVIVGRCADYILKHSEEVNQHDVLNVFVYAPLADRVERAIKEFNFEPSSAEKQVKQIDKRRGNHYNTFTERTWGNRTHYDILINSSLLGLEGTAHMISLLAQRT